MAGRFSFKRYTRSTPTSAGDQNRLREAVEDLQRTNGTPMRRLGQLLIPLPQYEDPFWIKINAGSGNPYTNWTAQDYNADGTTFIPDGALAGNGVLNAYEVNSATVTAGTVCLARMSADGQAVDFL